ncbi:hypothetical protein [Duncaniella muris]|nr:hypothetical protein [Duncaniella muris]
MKQTSRTLTPEATQTSKSTSTPSSDNPRPSSLSAVLRAFTQI